MERDTEKYSVCSKNNIVLVYYTNLENKAKDNDFYKDKKVFFEINNLRKFVSSYETTNQEKGI